MKIVRNVMVVGLAIISPIFVVAKSAPLLEKTITTQCLVSSRDGECKANTQHSQTHFESKDSPKFWKPLSFYTGFGLGYGDTDWSQLIGKDWKARIGTPESAVSGGLSAEVFFGYYLYSNLALEARYVHFSPATLHLDWASRDIVYHRDSLTTNTDDYALVAKFFVPVALQEQLKVFASFGANYTVREDELANLDVYGVTFGAGLQWRFAERFKTSFEFQYSTGYGDSVYNPVMTYVPFLYNLDLRIAYLFEL